jgi:hypothetical protein
MIPWTHKPGGRVPRPKTGETPIRHVRIGDPTWRQIVAIAEQQGRTVTAVVLDALTRYIAWYRRYGKRADDE